MKKSLISILVIILIVAIVAIFISNNQNSTVGKATVQGKEIVNAGICNSRSDCSNGQLCCRVDTRIPPKYFCVDPQFCLEEIDENLG